VPFPPALADPPGAAAPDTETSRWGGIPDRSVVAESAQATRQVVQQPVKKVLKDHPPKLSKRGLRIALIGPAYPYRGGIAHHTNMLALYLRKRGHQVDVITFTRQYPSLLYPGRSQEEPGEGGGFAETVHAQRLIDAINPCNWVRV